MVRRPTSRLVLLKILHEQPVVDLTGNAQSVLRKQYKLRAERSSNFSNVLKDCVDLSLVMIDRDEKKIFKIEISLKGVNYLQENLRFLPKPPAAKQAADKAEVMKTKATLVRQAPAQKPIDEIAELEKLGGIIQTVTDKMKAYEQLQRQLDATKSDYRDLLYENGRLRDEAAELRSQLAEERRRILAKGEEITSLRKKVASGRQAKAKSLRASDLPMVWRELGKKAIAQGWVINFTNGDHIKWLSPLGETYISSNTPSDSRATANLKAALVKRGLRLK